MPAGGATVTNLYAQLNNPPGVGNALANVRDNGTIVLSCQITGGIDTTCTAAGPVAVAAGHYLQVQITDGGTGTFVGRQWRVTFRY